MIAPITTTIRVERPGASEPYEGATYSVVASGVPAHISAPSGTERTDGGPGQEDTTPHLSCEPVELDHADRVIDEVTGATYQVVWATQRIGLGLDHTAAGLRKVTGIA